MIVLECGFDPPHTHEFPDDWIFGGANGLDPRADPRWKPTTYEYWNERAECIHITQTPLCDDQALDEFTKVASFGPTYSPHWLSAKRPNNTVEMLPWLYDKATDELYPKE